MKPKNLTTILEEFDKELLDLMNGDFPKKAEAPRIEATRQFAKQFICQSLTELLEESIIEYDIIDMEAKRKTLNYQYGNYFYQKGYNSARQEQIKKIRELKL